VAYYDTSGVGQIDTVSIPGAHVRANNGVNTVDLGSLSRGDTDVVHRLIDGVAWGELTDQLIGLPPPVALSLRRLTHRRKLPTCVGEALEFATFLTRTTIDMQRFTTGTLGTPWRTAGCGGVVSACA
jgi:hypothetical protein